MTEILALVPARGGSKGIYRKNLLSIAGKPLVAYSIEHGLRCKLVTRTICSTDDEEIAGVASEFGADVPFRRPDEYASDLATDLVVFKHALEWLKAEEGYEPELVVHLRPTDPVRKPERIDAAIKLMLEHPEADSLRSVSVSLHVPYKMWRIEHGYLQPLLELDDIPEAHSMPRQILPPTYEHVGYVDVIRPRTILEQHSMVGRVVLPYLIDEPTYDLDYPHQIAAIERALAEPRPSRRPSAAPPVVNRA
jgi:CMP-N,N'-diacetyllegionaminic acid synthase